MQTVQLHDKIMICKFYKLRFMVKFDKNTKYTLTVICSQIVKFELLNI